jgi:hypothetical protein
MNLHLITILEISFKYKIMKKHLALFIILFFSFLEIQAQDLKGLIDKPKHQFYAGYGGGTIIDLGNIFGNIFSLGTVKDEKYSGVIFAGYNHNLTEQFAADIKVSYQSYTANTYFFGTKTGTINDNYYSIVAGFSFQYSNTGFTRLYSGFNFGILVLNKNDSNYGTAKESTTNHMGFQITLLGIRTGGTVGGFLELGIGNTGFLSGGASVLF